MIRLLVLVLLLIAFIGEAAADLRYCGQPKRDASGRIVRSYSARSAFIGEVACPVNGSHKLSDGCPGWAIDHVWPLASCGCDAAVNMQWLPLAIKSCAGTTCKDRWERNVYLCKPEDRLP